MRWAAEGSWTFEGPSPTWSARRPLQRMLLHNIMELVQREGTLVLSSWSQRQERASRCAVLYVYRLCGEENGGLFLLSYDLRYTREASHRTISGGKKRAGLASAFQGKPLPAAAFSLQFHFYDDVCTRFGQSQGHERRRAHPSGRAVLAACQVRQSALNRRTSALVFSHLASPSLASWIGGGSGADRTVVSRSHVAAAQGETPGFDPVEIEQRALANEDPTSLHVEILHGVLGHLFPFYGKDEPPCRLPCAHPGGRSALESLCGALTKPSIGSRGTLCRGRSIAAGAHPALPPPCLLADLTWEGFLAACRSLPMPTFTRNRGVYPLLFFKSAGAAHLPHCPLLGSSCRHPASSVLPHCVLPALLHRPCECRLPPRPRGSAPCFAIRLPGCQRGGDRAGLDCNLQAPRNIPVRIVSWRAMGRVAAWAAACGWLPAQREPVNVVADAAAAD